MSSQFNNLKQRDFISPEIKTLRPGDFVLTRMPTLATRLISLGQRLRYRGADKHYSYWTHVALIVDTEGTVIESRDRPGVRIANISEYKNNPLWHVGITATDADRQQMVNFAKAMVGEEYGFLTIASLVLGLLTNLRLTFELSGTEICSTLVARALERGDYIWKDPTTIMPADLAKHFGV